MTISNFELLPGEQKERAIWEKGKYLINFELSGKIYDIYQLNNFYISLSYTPRKNERAKIECSIYPEQLPVFKDASHKRFLQANMSAYS